MGKLKIPAEGLIYLDTSALIYSVESHARYGPLLEPVWDAADSGAVQAATSELALLETLVGPHRSGNKLLLAAYDSLIQEPNMTVFHVSRNVLRRAAELRASYPALRAPDAIHAATCLEHGCGLFLTNDKTYRQIGSLPAIVLDEVLSG